MTEQVQNASGKAHCRHCCNDGWVIVAERTTGIEEMAPCPRCERGADRELAVYGDRGYWKDGSKDAGAIKPQCTHGQELPPPPGALENLRALFVELKDVPSEPPKRKPPSGIRF